MNKPVGRLGAAVEAAASGKSEDQRRIELARAERAGWMAARHASGYFAILSRRGLEVARFEKEADRDAVLLLAKLEAPAGAAATALAFEQEEYVNTKATDAVGFVQVTSAKIGLEDVLNDLRTLAKRP